MYEELIRYSKNDHDLKIIDSIKNKFDICNGYVYKSKRTILWRNLSLESVTNIIKKSLNIVFKYKYSDCTK